MLYFAAPDDRECERCGRDDVDTERHRLTFDDDRRARHANLCAPCVRRIRDQDNDVDTIT